MKTSDLWSADAVLSIDYDKANGVDGRWTPSGHTEQFGLFLRRDDGGTRLEIGFDHLTRSGLLVRPFTRFGWQYQLSETATKVRASLAGGPTGVADLELPIELGRDLFHAAIGLELFARRGLSLRLEYERTSADHLNVDSGTLRANYCF